MKSPLEVDMEVQRLRAVVDELYRGLMRHVRTYGSAEIPCPHVSMRPPHLPCPHPECYPEKQTEVYVEKLTPYTFLYRSEPEDHVGPKREHWRKQRILLGDEEVWAWRRA